MKEEGIKIALLFLMTVEKTTVSRVNFLQVKSELLKSVTWINTSDPPW